VDANCDGAARGTNWMSVIAVEHFCVGVWVDDGS
jgi:hypothetical protein